MTLRALLVAVYEFVDVEATLVGYVVEHVGDLLRVERHVNM